VFDGRYRPSEHRAGDEPRYPRVPVHRDQVNPPGAGAPVSSQLFDSARSSPELWLDHRNSGMCIIDARHHYGKG
jgi:hypothetical protein